MNHEIKCKSSVTIKCFTIMKTIYITLLVLLFPALAETGKAQITIDTLGNTIVAIETVVDSSKFAGGYDSGPWDLHAGPDSRLWYTNKKMVNCYDPSTGAIDTLLEIPSGYIMSITTHLDFANQPFVYLTVDTSSYYGQGTLIKVFRYTYDAVNDTLLNPLFLLQWGHGGEHSGGRLLFGSDTMLYVTTAEYYWQIDTLFNNSGKVLRLHPDGSVPVDNPRPDYTWTWGHRNPQGIVQTPNGNIIASEYGMINDELNLIEPGNHYGWFVFDGTNFFQPVDTCNYYQQFCKFPIDIGQNPCSGITWYDHPAIPEFHGVVEAVTGINQGIYVYGLNANMDSVINKTGYVKYEYGRVRDVVAFPDGSLYFIAYDRSMPRINKIYNPLFSSLPPEKNNRYQIYPNPSDGIVNVTGAAGNKNVTLTLSDLSGKIVTNHVWKGEPLQMDVAPGCYLLTISDVDKKQTFKWIKY